MLKYILTGAVTVALLASTMPVAEACHKKGHNCKVGIRNRAMLDALPLLVAEEAGIFTREKVNGEVVPVAASPQAFESLDAEKVDLISVSNFEAVVRLAENPRYKILGGTLSKPLLWLVVDPRLKDIRQLSERRVAVSERKGYDAQFLQMAFKAKGVAQPEAIPVQGMQDFPELLKAEKVFAGLLYLPYAAQVDRNRTGVILDGMWQYQPQFPDNLLIAREDWAKRNAADLVSLLRVISMGSRWLNDPKNSERVVNIISKRLGIQDLIQAQTIYKKAVVEAKAFSADLKVDSKGLDFVRQMVEVRAGRKYLLESPIDDSYRQRAVK